MKSVAFFGLSTLLCVFAQDMQGSCITCTDTFYTCKLNCVMPHFREGEALAWPYNTPVTYEQVESCLSVCQTQQESCVDTEEALACLECATACATTYDGAMRACLSTVSTTTKATANANLDACSNEASYTMDTCIAACSDEDKYDGWTPEKEAGVASELQTMKRFSVPKQTPTTVEVKDTVQKRKLVETEAPVKQEKQSFATAIGLAAAASGTVLFGGIFLAFKITAPNQPSSFASQL